MGRPLNLPADLIKSWAGRHAAANAKLEGRELPHDYVRSVQAEQFLKAQRAQLAERIEMENLWG